MKEYELKYGCNPLQKPAKIFVRDTELPVKIHSGRPGYINFLDALSGWQLASELAAATGKAAAASFKHVSPAGAAIGLPAGKQLARAYFAPEFELSPQATAYLRARGADRMSSYGDFVAFSHTCDLSAARLLMPEVSDGIIAPAFEPEALELLKTKRGGNYTILEIDPLYTPPEIERKDVFGITFEQRRNDAAIDRSLLQNIVTQNKNLPDVAATDLIVALITLKYTQSNSVCYAKDGQAIGVGAGQQSRIHCVRLAGDKADIWHLRQHPKIIELPFIKGLKRPDRDNAIDILLSDYPEDAAADGVWEKLFTRKPEILTREEKKQYLGDITGVSLASDAFFPFGDNIERAKRSGVSFIAQPGGSVRDDHVISACDKYGMTMAFTGLRLFHH